MNAKKHLSTWAKFDTPEKRRKEALRRMAMRKDSMAERMMGKAPKKSAKRDKELQDLYLARSKAKRLGLPVPPLPKESSLKSKAAVTKALTGMRQKPSPAGPGTNRKILTAEERAKKQRIYGERYEAKTKGLKPPPLPGRKPLTAAEKRERDRVRHQQARDLAKAKAKAQEAKAKDSPIPPVPQVDAAANSVN